MMAQDESLETTTRLEAMTLLGEERNELSLPILHKFLAHPKARLREEAIHLLYFAFQDRNALPLIVERLLDGAEQTEVRMKALAVLKHFRAPETIPPILEFLSRRSGRIPATPHEEMTARQEIEAALDTAAVLLELTENAHAFSLARGRSRKELFARLLEACRTRYQADIGYLEAALIVS